MRRTTAPRWLTKQNPSKRALGLITVRDESGMTNPDSKMAARRIREGAEPTEKDRLWVESMPEAYDRWLAPAVFHPFAVDLARRAARLAPRRVLEIAAGTGVLTRELIAAIPWAEVTATDLSAPMVEFGSRRAPGAAWQQADALRLPFGDKRFDLVVCQFGVMFFADRPAAFREMLRVLTPEGSLLFSTWGTVDAHGFAAALMAGVERAFPDAPPMFIVAVPHGYSDVGQVAADLAAGGLDCVAAEPVTLDGHSGSAADVAAGFCTGTPLRMAIEDRGDLMAAIAAVSEEMKARLGAAPVTAKMTAYVIEAQPRA
jgi:SAM-dependent methyltransferase